MFRWEEIRAQIDEQKSLTATGEYYGANPTLDDLAKENHGEGCLSKDGSAFAFVIPGIYMGDGNHVLRYDISGNILEEAQKINENMEDRSRWIDPPTSFGKMVGNVIKMKGGSGDAGCWSKTEFDYNIVENKIKMTRRCAQCEGEKEQCSAY